MSGQAQAVEFVRPVAQKVRPRLPGFIDDEISQRDKLIEQMRRALEYALTKVWSRECERLIKAALLAAERVEK